MTISSHQRALAWIASTAFFMQALDATILNTALPAIAQALQQPPLEMQLAVISYTLTVALFIPLSGWLADRYGTGRLFRVAVTIFVIGSLFCSLAYSLSTLVVARIVQGLGGALMMPVARLAIIRTVPKHQLFHIWNIMAMAGLIGPILGPILGGWLVTYTSWHWIFLINIPIGLLGIVLSRRYMPNVKGEFSKLDWLGFLLFGGGLVSFTLGLELLAGQGNFALSLLILFSGIGFFLGYVRYARQKDSALLPLSLFKLRTFNLCLIANLLIRLCASGIPFLLPLMLQVLFHYPADITGWLLMPIALGSISVKPMIARLLQRFSYKNILISTALCITAIVALLSLSAQTHLLWLHLLLCFSYGICISILFSAINTLTISELDEHNASAGSTMLSVIQQIGIGIGIAVSSIILHHYRYTFSDLSNAFSATFLISAVFGIILIVCLRFLRQNDGENLRHPNVG